MIRGKVHKFGDNIDTDVIIPARYLNDSDPDYLRLHVMEDIDPDFSSRVLEGDIIVSGSNFGCGSSREHAPIAIKAAGISIVIASDFARIFYRNSINVGLRVLECREAYEKTMSGDILEIDENSGKINNITRNETYEAKPFPPFINKIIECGGLVSYAMNNLGRE